MDAVLLFCSTLASLFARPPLTSQLVSASQNRFSQDFHRLHGVFFSRGLVGFFFPLFRPPPRGPPLSHCVSSFSPFKSLNCLFEIRHLAFDCVWYYFLALPRLAIVFFTFFFPSLAASEVGHRISNPSSFDFFFSPFPLLSLAPPRYRSLLGDS